MNRSREWFERVSRDSGYGAATLEKVTRLGELAAEIGRHPLLGSALVLKGGTALNLCFGEPSRLSVDLDFNFVGGEDRQEMLEQRPVVERAIAAVARAQGYRLQWSRAEHAGRKAYLGYRSSAGVADRIEIDLNFLHRVKLDPPFTAELWQPGDAPRPNVTVVNVGELVSGKLCALLDRAAPRDLYDELLRVAQEGAVLETISGECGTKYIVEGEVHMPGGGRAVLATVWLADERDARPRLITAYPGAGRDPEKEPLDDS